MNLTYRGNGLLTEDEVFKLAETLEPYRQELTSIVTAGGYDHDEASLNLLADGAMYKEVTEFAATKRSSELKYIVVVGIGGANLGAKAIYDAIFGHVDSSTPERFPKILWLDTCNPQHINAVKKIIGTVTAPAEIMVVIASKSGNTTEMMVNANEVLSALETTIGETWPTRVVALSSADTILWNLAGEHGFSRIAIPAKIGGRFSVFSAMGLLPLALCGMDIGKLLDGAKAARSAGLAQSVDANPALAAAIVMYYQMQKGMAINDIFLFNPELESVGRWERQLIAETTGKTITVNGLEVRVGITPTVLIGSTDLHSLGQLALAGPKNRITSFVIAEQPEPMVMTRKTLLFQDQTLKDHSAGRILKAIFQGVREAYVVQQLPFIHYTLEDLSLKSIGGYMQSKMMMAMYLGKLLGVNAFDQPAVELYKAEVKKILDQA